MNELKNTYLPSEEMRWKQFYASGYEEILNQEFPHQTLWNFMERGILAAKQFDEKVGILHDMPVPVECVALRVVVMAFAVDSVGIKRFAPSALRVAGAYEAGL